MDTTGSANSYANGLAAGGAVGPGQERLLEGKTALIYGAGGNIGGAVARGFAARGAAVYLAGRHQKPLDVVAKDIADAGATAETAVVDALDEEAVDAFTEKVVKSAKRIDVVFNAISYGEVQQPLMDISADDFTRPIATAARTHFLTTRAAARQMLRQRSGVVLMFGGSGPQTQAGMGGFKIALDTMEGLRRQWALELGKQGIRVVTMVTGGIVETIPWQEEGREDIVREIGRSAHLNTTATLEDVGTVAAWIASDQARVITDATINISAGAIVDY
ncbi:SDR family oxidoreductase [Pseudarthrobacter sp. J64]|uniref:SDR family NAD(P)-dependent oxidoreductase n=1 Tax=Pseudarthrobacter sp. J64 TaxID=3116485 RepID=UPI002E80B7F5|nr:SDR family oxidoreductase [Pseudarthrobacter sp. J64]MEE2570408.1 SDR family oxidoreductase [Pseudarthrobacter sp. J64]